MWQEIKICNEKKQKKIPERQVGLGGLVGKVDRHLRIHNFERVVLLFLLY